ncbi:protein-ADP-ribose hydrolase [Sellimonas caecigallum]|uniref:Protein-ADP-ribose hydrolase n=1 Tax=Sellimonas caecigallum TaxID=2592333 RepID=A0ABS7L3U8_9FIRM|nr:protein-ADP-ribose hydrolase [Sellimonas caecigallum]MBY0757709.1 protein-ADP-ribose hydrolase [Sellimonas caecigallum]
MTQTEKRLYLIRELMKEDPKYGEMKIPDDEQSQKNMLRALFNLRMPEAADKEFLLIQDAYLQEEIRRKGITDLADLKPAQQDLYLWKGDITTLKCDAIVNAANSQMLGCFLPCHGCIDNAIHTYAGVQLRQACARIMEQQDQEEETGKAKITSAFNLPSKYILHTVGPIIRGRLREEDKTLLESCYRSCLELAESYQLKSIAFCCISTGEFHFPNSIAAEIAVSTVKEYKGKTGSKMEVIFNVFKEEDYRIYERLLRTD